MAQRHKLTGREVASVARSLRMLLKIEARLEALETQTSSRLTDNLRDARYAHQSMLYKALGERFELAGELDPETGEWV
jgi:hypothetical protein